MRSNAQTRTHNDLLHVLPYESGQEASGEDSMTMTVNGIPADGRWHVTGTLRARRPHEIVRFEKRVALNSVVIRTRWTCHCGAQGTGLGIRWAYGHAAHVRKVSA